ncbi:MAG: HD domain-containing protein [Lachnospiraceae bacterium]|nr:HD domain-containing protein [Lachnospiraceae bacterium]
MFNLYLEDLYINEGGLKKIPLRLRISGVLFIVGTVFLIIGVATHLFYSFDEQNRYQRSPYFLLSYVFPLIIVIIQFTVIIQYRKLLSRLIYISLLLFSIIPVTATLIQVFAYGLSLTNISVIGTVIIIYIFSLLDLNDQVKNANELKIGALKNEQKKLRLLFEETAEALVAAIDAKDKYTHGHSARVAEYSEKLARLAGKSDEEVEEVYYSALLHDVGKIGIQDTIINKEGKLTEEEFSIIKTHPVIGKQILSSIEQSPYLSIGANYHHERYDGKGYPEGLKGEDIPEIARIIAVADAYDAMTSKRSYRDPIPQQRVREELVKGMGYQFDPEYAKLMVHLIDLDLEYSMKEHEEIKELAGKDELLCTDYRKEVSEGIFVNENPITIKLKSVQTSDEPTGDDIPSMIMFDSLDSRVHSEQKKIEDMLYMEYGTICFDGKTECLAARKIETEIDTVSDKSFTGKTVSYKIVAFRVKDHAVIRISDGYKDVSHTIALPDNSHFLYLSLTGRNCHITDVNIIKSEETVDESVIKRIADKISYIDVPAGDIPNVQADTWRSATSRGIPLTDGLKITYHAKSLPTSRLIWHCSFLSIYTSDDGTVNGNNFREFAFIRLDGESWDEEELSENVIYTNKDESFEDWNSWRLKNKEGVDCSVSVKFKNNMITVFTEDAGLSAKNVTKLLGETGPLYIAITGDECAITNIRIHNK